jgi:hypothetical protein
MKFQGPVVWASVIFTVGLVFCGPGRASRVPRVELLREVTVAGSRILLSDLLPPVASEPLRASASQISMGAAPQPGNSRILERDAIARQEGVSEEVLEQVSIPERIVVSSQARSITLNEVFEVIRAALKRNGIASGETLRPEDILLESQVFVGPGDSGLHVMRMDFDRGLGRARFLLWPSSDPKVLPFFVTARLAGELPGLLFRSAPELSRIAKVGSVVVVSARPAKQEVLVERGEQATLMLRSDTLRMFVDVVSLERGTLGQRIRVRMMDTGKVVNAQVDGRSHLEVKF